HHGVVSQAGVGSQQKKQVGHVGDGDSAVGADALPVPPVHQVLTAQPLDLDVGVGVGDMDPGAEHDHVHIPFGLAAGGVDGDDSVAGDAGDVVGNDFGLGIGDGAVIGGGIQDSLATDAIP